MASFNLTGIISGRNQCTLRIDVQRPYGLPQLPAPKHAWGIFDTGASGSLIHRDLYRELGLEQVAPALLENPASERRVQTFSTFAHLVLRDNQGGSLPIDLALLVAPGRMKPHIVLGMDALDSGVFSVDFGARLWTLKVEKN